LAVVQQFGYYHIAILAEPYIEIHGYFGPVSLKNFDVSPAAGAAVANITNLTLASARVLANLHYAASPGRPAIQVASLKWRQPAEYAVQNLRVRRAVF